MQPQFTLHLHFVFNRNECALQERRTSLRRVTPSRTIPVARARGVFWLGCVQTGIRGKVASYIQRATQGRGLNWFAAIADYLVDVSSRRNSKKHDSLTFVSEPLQYPYPGITGTNRCACRCVQSRHAHRGR